MKKPFFQYLLLTGIFLSLTAGYGFGQERNNMPVVVPPSPNAASLGKYGDIPVSPYTGVPGVDIPIYEIVSGDIKVPVSISYHGSGIKVAEEAGRIGLGWALNAGGVISRTVLGGDDFLYPSYFNTAFPEIPEGPLTGPMAWVQTGNQPQMYNKGVPGMPSVYNLDLSEHIQTFSDEYFQPDQYTYNFNGHSGKFVLKRNKVAVLSKQDKIKISVQGTEGNSWEVFTADGFRYLFEVFETYDDGSTSQKHKSSWYLTKIISPSGRVVTFNYKQVSEQYIKPVGAFTESNQLISMPAGTGYYSCPTSSWQAEIPAGKYYSGVLLESIDFDNGIVVFEYEDRIDLEGDKRVKNIQVYQKNARGIPHSEAAKSFVFGYDYFTSTMDKNDYYTGGLQSYVTKRLKLLSLQEISGTDATKTKNPYLFSYIEGSNYRDLPAKTSFARDHWGYFNGKYETTSLIPRYVENNSTDPVRKMVGNILPDRASNPAYISAFSLKEINYPTKGTTTLDYEGHTFDVEASRKQDDSFFADAPTLEQTYKNMSHSKGNNGTVVVKELDLSDLYLEKDAVTAKVTIKAGVRLDRSCKDTYVNGSDAYFELYYPSGARVSNVNVGDMSCGDYVFEYSNHYFLKPGKYTWKAYISSSNTTIMDISASYGYLKEKGVGGSPGEAEGIYDFAGGLRIKRITDQDNITGKKSVKRYHYHYSEDRNSDGTMEEYSYGIRMAVPQYTYFDLVQQKVDGDITPTTEYEYCARLFRTSDSNIPLNGSAAGSVVGYSQVELLYGENGENGKTRFEYENQPDVVLDYFIYGLPMRPAAVPNIPNEKNGMLIRQKDYASQNGVFSEVRVVENINVSEDGRLIYGIEKRNHNKVGYSGDPFGFTGSTTADGLMPNELDVYFYPAIKSTRTYVSKTTETTIQASGTPLTRVTEYLYENKAHLQPTTIITTINQHKQEVTRIKYPADFSTTAASSQIEQMKGAKHMHSIPLETTTFLREAGLDKITAKTISEFGFFGTHLQKKAVYAIETNEPLALSEVPPYDPKATVINAAYKNKVIYSYYDNGNLKEVIPYNQPPITYLWAYNSKLPVAEIKNATYSQVNAALNLSPAIVLESTVDSFLDDAGMRSRLETLRSRLPQALISSYTYKPLEGVSSFTDPAGNVSFFEYDDLDRLQLVKDHNGDIVKTYDYNYKQP